jgi:pimeloyl-ACP methyl ester carboxylesterase
VYCQRTHNPPQDVQRRAAELLRAEWLAIDSAHLPFFTNPDEVAHIVAERSR